MKVLKKYHLYFKERFQIGGYLVFIASIYYSSYLFSFRLSGKINYNSSNIKTFFGFIVIFLFCLQLRIFDEHKDYDEDKISYPNRMLSKGEITLLDLRKVLYSIIIIQIILNYFTGLNSIILWLIMFLWSILMLKEFFMPEYLKKKPVLYLISHQIIISLICIYSINMRIDVFTIKKSDLLYIIIFLIGITCLTIIFHLIKKLKKIFKKESMNGNKFFENIISLDLIGLISFLSNLALYVHFKYNYIFLIIIILLYLIFISLSVVYSIKSTERNLKLFIISSYLYILGVLINSAIGFYNM